MPAMHTLEHELFRDASGAYARLVRLVKTPGVPVGLFVAQSGAERGELFFSRITDWTLSDDDPRDDRATRVSGGSADVLRGRRGLHPDEWFTAQPAVAAFLSALRSAAPDLAQLAKPLARGARIATPTY